MAVVQTVKINFKLDHCSDYSKTSYPACNQETTTLLPLNISYKLSLSYAL